MRRGAFSLVELLVVVSIIAILAGILLPSLAAGRKAAQRTKCLANMRSLEIAHTIYMHDNKGLLINVGLAHGGTHVNPLMWFNTLEQYYGSKLVARSPVDDSPHWGPAPVGSPIPNAPSTQRRVTSYGVNNFLDSVIVPWGGPYRLDTVPRPSATVHFLLMAFTGEFAGADHPHVENWTGSQAPLKAQQQVQINAHGGPGGAWGSVSTWGFLDGHTSVLPFREVFTNVSTNPSSVNRFDPIVAR